MGAIGKVKEVLKAEDLDAIMAMISDDFEFSEVGGKEELRDFLQSAFDMGYIEMYADETEIKTDKTEIEVEGDKATVYPIDVEGSWGSVTVEIEAKREGDAWRIVDLYIEGI